MSKYNPYVKRLEAAFMTARKTYKDAYQKVRDAEAAVERAADTEKRLRSNTTLRDVELHMNAEQAAINLSGRKYELEKAKSDFREVERTAWQTYEDSAKALRRELELAIRQDYGVKSAAVDANCMALLSSGILKASDFAALAEEFKDNATMTRLIRKHIQDAASSTDDREERKVLTALADSVRIDEEVYLEEWDAIAKAAHTFSGASEPKRPQFRINMSNKWESYLADAVANF